MLACRVLSDSLQPHGLQPDRLVCPWNFLGKNTGVGCHFLHQHVSLTQGLNPHLTLWADSLPVSHRRSPSQTKVWLKGAGYVNNNRYPFQLYCSTNCSLIRRRKWEHISEFSWKNVQYHILYQNEVSPFAHKCQKCSFYPELFPLDLMSTTNISFETSNYICGFQIE